MPSAPGISQLDDFAEPKSSAYIIALAVWIRFLWLVAKSVFCLHRMTLSGMRKPELARPLRHSYLLGSLDEAVGVTSQGCVAVS